MSLILIVEDDRDQGELLQELLEGEGYRALVAKTGRQALAAMVEECPAVVLTDFTLPDMDGREFIRRARELSTATPHFVLTTGVHPSRVAGVADVVLYKPLDVSQVLASVRRLCSAAGPRQHQVAAGNQDGSEVAYSQGAQGYADRLSSSGT